MLKDNYYAVKQNIPSDVLLVAVSKTHSAEEIMEIYAEGQRRYVESLSTFARQFLDNVDKPDVDVIEGLSPAISIDQKTTSNNPRSTVGTVTEIYDYLRLLYGRAGTPYCPHHHIPIEAQTIPQMLERIMSYEDGSRMMIMAPVVKRQKGTQKDLLEKLRKEGYIRVRVDEEIRLLEEDIVLDKNKNHNIDVIVDRIVKNENSSSRIHDSLETALKLADGLAVVNIGNEDILFSQNYACPICGFSLPRLEPRLFSFNSPLGACHTCNGLGFTLHVDPDLLVPDWNLPIRKGGIRYYKNIVDTKNIEWQTFKVLLDHYNISEDKPMKEMSERELNLMFHGSDEPIEYHFKSSGGNNYHKTEYIEGVADMIERRYWETTSAMSREWYATYMAETECHECHGSRLNEQALCVQVGGKNIHEFTQMSVKEALYFVEHLQLEPMKAEIARLVLKEISDRLHFLQDVGLEYLTLDRMAGSLSGGEAQRIRLATQIGSNLTGVMYVLDEPSIGLHQRDNAKLIATLKNMRDLGNSVIVVEHDEETMLSSDYIIDIGPGAGKHGGEVVAAGTPEEVMRNDNSITGRYLSHKMAVPYPEKRRKGSGKVLRVIKASEHNLKNINVNIPLGTFVCVTGVSGSGKSTLVMETITKCIQQNLGRLRIRPGQVREVRGMENIDKIIVIDQDPIGRTPRSNPVTYTGVFDLIREVFAQSVEAKVRGYSKSRFSFNVAGGRCERCWGDGVKRISMNFLPDVYVPCEECGGKRYNKETLEVTYKGKNIYDVLEMTVEEAIEFFSAHPRIRHGLQTLSDVGLDYIKLGQSATTLSGGEAQRVKLASELQRKATGKTLFVLDEPTTGLHTHDVRKLLDVLQRIVNNGDTVIVIEHNLDVIKNADYIIDLGPEGGDDGGEVVACGTPEQVAAVERSYTGQYLKKILNGGELYE